MALSLVGGANAIRVNRSALRRYPSQYLLCRDQAIGHDWDVIESWTFNARLPTGGHELRRVSRCTRCTGHRTELFHHGPDGLLHKIKNRYRMPVDYAWPVADYGPLSASEIYTEQARLAKSRKKTAVPVGK